MYQLSARTEEGGVGAGQVVYSESCLEGFDGFLGFIVFFERQPSGFQRTETVATSTRRRFLPREYIL